MKWMLVALAALGLAGCAFGIKEDATNAAVTRFTLPVSYQVAYHRAEAFARHCHMSDSMWSGSMNVDADLFTETKTGVVHINMPGGGRDLERIEITAVGDASNIALNTWKVGVWDEIEIMAARKSMTEGTPVCRNKVLR